MSEKNIDKEKLNEFKSEKGFLEINNKGNLEFDGYDCTELADKYDTPVYVISEKRIRENYRNISNAFKTIYEATNVSYACKANPNLNVLKIIKDEGSMAEVISTGELFLAKIAGFDGSNIVFNGCNKNRKGIRLAIEMGALINIDSLQELHVIAEEAEDLDETARIAVRVNPVVRTGTLDVWETALEDSKFGVSMKKAFKVYEKAKSMEKIEIVGIHTHIGSHITNEEPYKIATKRIMDLVVNLKEKLGINLEVIDMGGGFPIPFHYQDVPSIDPYAHAILDTFMENIEKHDLKKPKLILEPGGSIIGDTSILLLEVGIIKENENSNNWAYVDGGANINLRATQGWYTYQTVCCNKMKKDNTKTYQIGGPLCYSGDVLGKDRELPPLEEGDLIGMLDCGAYTMAILNRYNSHPFPAIVLLRENKPEIIRKREDYTDLLTGEKFIL
ncbi:MAG: diaminopimelate decarboxylase [Thermoplasmatota archaeon]